ncbi:hypothetical protein Ancab_023118 [Ancistrocladus abbreviatus]
MGRRFGFVRFKDVDNAEVLVRSLGDIWPGSFKLRVSFAREKGLLATTSPVSHSRLQRPEGRVFSSGLSYVEAVKRGVVPVSPSLVVGSDGEIEAHFGPSSIVGLSTGTQSFGRSDGVGLQGRHSPSSPREDPRSSCLLVTGGFQGPNSKLLKRAKRKHGISVKRGKPTRRHYNVGQSRLEE